MYKTKISACFLGLIVLIVAGAHTADSHASSVEDLQKNAARPHIVFVIGDQEYRSEESMPMLARILKNRFGFKVTLCFAQTNGVIDPNSKNNIPGLKALEGADMMVMFMRFQQLPEHQLKYILEFAESGKPMVGFRTATHAFRYGEDHHNHYLDTEWPQQVFGLSWEGRGEGETTAVSIVDKQAGHPILRGVKPFHALSHLYHSVHLNKSATPLLTGSSIEGDEADGEVTGEPHVIAWTQTYQGERGASRVFATTLGHPKDFFRQSMRKLAINGIFWALGMKEKIPNGGLDVAYVGDYEPNEAGMGNEYKQDRKPEDVLLDGNGSK